ncbi:uncharacterized protein MEPE_06114 [Melanopsichium pennsylvanicum]|uniref:SET domain-containing protein n=2 Tax=Melanopsichium pennsylvanicum TaxID=63383 RepID=A0AAJ5C8E1_9BASI|nr:uncharacterized protein MEPE_06114 [Melanopsichium pennsylvanicum]
MSFFASLGLPEASTSRVAVTVPHIADHEMSHDHSLRNNNSQNQHEEKVTFASKEIKALSALRSNPQYLEMIRSVDVGQAFQLSLINNPPLYFPEYEGLRLLQYFQCWVDQWEVGHQGLSVDNPNASNIGDVIPPWDFCWTDDYLLDPSVPPLSHIKPRPTINGYQLTDELCVDRGCDCEDDECDPRTCSCLKRAAECYPFEGTYYQRMFDPNALEPDGRPPRKEFVYEDGRLRNNIPVGTPIFECNSKCPCADSCRNRVVQKGKRAPLAFCKTASKGWGIKATELIPAGTFVGAYGGELLADEEAERRANVYDQKLGTTYLQTVDSHILKVHLTQQIIEKDLAEKNELQFYRGSPEKQRRMVQLVTKTADHIELYEEYFKYLEGETEPELYHAELRKRDKTLPSDQEQIIFVEAKKDAERRARKAAQFRRSRKAMLDSNFDPASPIDPSTEYYEPVWNFLALPPNEQAYARSMQMIRSDMEDERFVTVDSALWGNHTRFFNHSCDPNIYHVPVYTNDASIMRPLLAFFTLRQVDAGEELCFSYAGDMGSDDIDVSLQAASGPSSPTKTGGGGGGGGGGRRSGKVTTIHTPSTKPGKDTMQAIKATKADAEREAGTKGGAPRLGITCQCGARNCTGRVFA